MKKKNFRARTKPHSTIQVEQAEREVRAAKTAAKQAKLDLKDARKAAKQAKKRFRAAKKELKVLLKELRQSENKIAERKMHRPKAKRRPERQMETAVPATLMPRKSRPKIVTAKPANRPARRLPLENPSQHDDATAPSPVFDPASVTFGTVPQKPAPPTAET